MENPITQETLRFGDHGLYAVMGSLFELCLAA
jgi:hypothetical protein